MSSNRPSDPNAPHHRPQPPEGVPEGETSTPAHHHPTPSPDVAWPGAGSEGVGMGDGAEPGRRPGPAPGAPPIAPGHHHHPASPPVGHPPAPLPDTDYPQYAPGPPGHDPAAHGEGHDSGAHMQPGHPGSDSMMSGHHDPNFGPAMELMHQMPRGRILIVDDEPNLRKVLGALMTQQGYEVFAEPDGAAALDRVRAAPPGTFDVVISDLRMPRMDGMQLLKSLLMHEPGLPVLMLTAHGTVDTAVEAVKLGAFDFLEKPFDRDQVDQIVAKAIDTRRRTGPMASPLNPALAHGMVDPSMSVGMVGQSHAMYEVREMIRTVAASPSTVLIMGESGTGKELVAQALHRGSDRAQNPLIRVNCAAIPATLVESELFGHERGAFTGAVSSRPGRFELADRGTLFLDEVSEIPLEIQVKLLRAIQESQFERVGGVKTLDVDVRLIAATNRDLETEIAEQRFREDLFYRLNVVPIHLPPLRNRPEDVPPLVDHFVARANERLGKQVHGFDARALVALQHHRWPGNIRELENLVERMVLFASGPEISADELPEPFQRIVDPTHSGNRGRVAAAGGPAEADAEGSLRLPRSILDLDLKEAVRAGSRLVEETLIREALGQTDYNVTRSARLLGISRRSLQSKMKELGLRDQGEGSGTR